MGLTKVKQKVYIKREKGGKRIYLTPRSEASPNTRPSGEVFCPHTPL
jgi:hypothetical protein